MSDLTGTPGAASAVPPTPLPPLYRALEVVTPTRHGGLRIAEAGPGFAAATNIVPLAAEEFVSASRTFPIVFTDEAPHLPVAVTTLRPGEAAVSDHARRPDAYVPAYLRRYPFLLARLAPDAPDLALCIDPTAPQVSSSSGDVLFDTEGKPSAALQRALEFCGACEAAMMRTTEMVLRLDALGMLTPSSVQVVQQGRALRLDGFRVVDRAALQALRPEILGELRDKGWLEAIYAHLASVAAFADLARDSTPARAPSSH